MGFQTCHSLVCLFVCQLKEILQTNNVVLTSVSDFLICDCFLEGDQAALTKEAVLSDQGNLNTGGGGKKARHQSIVITGW